MLPLQEIFDKVATHLLKQNKRSTAGASCSYCITLADGEVLMCAVGCLIKPEVYDSRVEGLAIGGILGLRSAGLQLSRSEELLLYALRRSGLPTDLAGLELLKDLQQVHDRELTDDWRDKLRIVAQAHKLSTQILGD